MFAGLIHSRNEKKDVRRMIDSLNVRTLGPGEKVALLSGGNQQKVVFGKGLYTESQIYIFEEPTVGVDVGAKAGIYHLIRELSKDKAVIVASSDCEEIYGLSDHVVVLYKGKVVLDKPVMEVRLEEMLLCGLTGGKDAREH
jgi:ribose transport system ATP-binding protein